LVEQDPIHATRFFPVAVTGKELQDSANRNLHVANARLILAFAPFDNDAVKYRIRHHMLLAGRFRRLPLRELI